MTSLQGYYRYPTLHKETVVFVSEDDLWEAPISGGIARRLTSGQGKVSHPQFSPDGQWIAYTATEEGHGEVYVMPATGGRSKRLTFTGSTALVVGWLNKTTILFVSAFKQPFDSQNEVYGISVQGGLPEKIEVGPANFIHHNPEGKGTVIQRHGNREFGYWKRYRGGMTGDLWIDAKGNGTYAKLIHKHGNFVRPLWVGGRIYFAGDHEGHGNLYSCKPDGSDLCQEASAFPYYIRNQSTDGRAIVFHAGGDLYYFDPQKKARHKILIEYQSPFTQRNRKFVSAQRYIQGYDLHPHGHHTALTARGRAFAFSNFEGGTLPFGHENQGRYRLVHWLHDGRRLVVVNDMDGEEKLEIYDAETLELLDKMKKPEVGRIVDMMTSPLGDEVIVANHKNEIVHVDLKKWKITVLDRSEYSPIGGMDWSPDGKWVAYGCALSRHLSVIKLANLKTGKVTSVTKPVLMDYAPSFDPDGKYLYFISSRQFNPAWDTLHFNMGFPLGSKPYLLTLQKDTPNPFIDAPHDLSKPDEEEETPPSANKKKAKPKVPEMTIDLEAIESRIIAFPLPDGNYSSVTGIKGKVLYTAHPVHGSLDGHDHEDSEAEVLSVYDFSIQKPHPLINNVLSYSLSKDHNWLIYMDAEHDLRVVKAGEKPDDNEELPLKKRGWICLDRLKVPVTPDYEWRQIFKEAWRLQRDHFWVEDMSKVDWLTVYNRYWPLVDRVGTREELSDLLWEMAGELGTSHAYVIGGDIKKSPSYTVGLLGADFAYDKAKGGFRIDHIVQGDIWKPGHSSPLAQPGLNIHPGDILLEVAGQQLSETLTPQAALVNYAGQEVRLKIAAKSGKKKRVISVHTLHSEKMARYREWVDANREYVHTKTKGKIGYVHVPNMGPWGFSEFHRYFLAESEREGLVVDIRFNGGGNISYLLLEKLARKQLGYDLTRWMGTVPYPYDSLAGPIAAITNEYAGSDGDIFSHSFKLMKLGSLIGKRTWGGVIGVSPRYSLVDKGYTTQPEFSFWFKDIGWKIENYGAEPDIEVEITPHEYKAGKDPQLDKAIEILTQDLKENPLLKPTFSKKPNLKLPA